MTFLTVEHLLISPYTTVKPTSNQIQRDLKTFLVLGGIHLTHALLDK